MTYNFQDLFEDELLQAQITMFVTQLAIRKFIENYTGKPSDYLPPPGKELRVIVTHDYVYFKHIYVPPNLPPDAREIVIK
jgi:hypothetical protein